MRLARLLIADRVLGLRLHFDWYESRIRTGLLVLHLGLLLNQNDAYHSGKLLLGSDDVLSHYACTIPR